MQTIPWLILLLIIIGGCSQLKTSSDITAYYTARQYVGYRGAMLQDGMIKLSGNTCYFYERYNDHLRLVNTYDMHNIKESANKVTWESMGNLFLLDYSTRQLSYRRRNSDQRVIYFLNNSPRLKRMRVVQ